MTEVMTDKDVPLDAPPSYTSATAIVPYRVPHAASSAATTMAIAQRAEVQQRGLQYSCANPAMEKIERIARVAFIVILIIYVASTIAVVARINTTDAINEYYDYNDDYYEKTSNILIYYIMIMLAVSMCCTIGALLCDIPVMIAHFVTNKVMNSLIFRTLDIIKWIVLTIGYIFTFAWIEFFTATGSDFTPGPLIIICLVFCCIIIVMGLTMAVWDCANLSILRTTTPLSQIVTMVPTNLVATTAV